MPVFRCAYCHQELGSEPPKGPCPSCGKRMLVPEKLQKVSFRERQRARMIKERDAERKTATQVPAVVALEVTRNKPMFILIALGLLLVVGSALVSRSCVVAKGQTGPTRKHRTATRELAALYGGLEGFRFDCGTYPDESNGLNALIFKLDNPKWNGPYVNWLKSDPWRHRYIYRPQGTGFVLKSLGPDGVESADDIHADVNWTNQIEFAPNPPVEPVQ
jgi:general secretion pathway protein G